MAGKQHEVLLCPFEALLPTDFMYHAALQQCHQGEIARFLIVKVRCDTEKVDRMSVMVQEMRVAQEIDTESEVMQNLFLADLGAKADLWKTKNALYGVGCVFCISRSVEKVEKAKRQSRRKREASHEARELGENQTVYPVQRQPIEYDSTQQVISTAASSASALTILEMHT